MFIGRQGKDQVEYYSRMLGLLGSLTRLFSESQNPFIEYRTAENLFCKAFNATNLSRADVSADASKAGLGIGIKTFLDKNGNTFEKVAEFNDANPIYRDLSDREQIKTISRLRNERIEFTKRAYGLNDLIYHCVTRADGKIFVYECDFRSIDLNRVRLISTSASTLVFSDGLEEYKFSRSKSTLYKRFFRKSVALEVPVSILPDPFKALEEIISSNSPLPGNNDLTLQMESLFQDAIAPIASIYLPLYSFRGGVKTVFDRSGLNQWNAGGRQRDMDEVYIPIPAWIHVRFPDFFPSRDELFKLLLPDGETLDAKVCQQGSKALMSNPNKALGQWLLRQVLGLAKGELLTYETLERVGIDSVLIDKLEDGTFKINFSKTGSFESFESDFRT